MKRQDGSTQHGDQTDASFYANLEKPPEPNIRQQNKIIAAMLKQNGSFLQMDSVDITPDEKRVYLKTIATDKINDNSFKRYLEGINSGIAGRTKIEVFEDINEYRNSKQLKVLIAYALDEKFINKKEISGETYEKYSNIDADHIPLILNYYKEPVTFEKVLEPILQNIKKNNGENKYQEYKKSLQVLSRILFGKRQEYWEQYKLLRDEAKDLEKMVDNLRDEGFINRSYNESKDTELSDKEKRAKDEVDSERVKTRYREISQRNVVPLYFYTDSQIHFKSVPINENLSDEECEDIIKGMAIILRRNISKEKIDMKKQLIGIFMPKQLDEEVKNGAFGTKNAIYRTLLSHKDTQDY